MLILMATGLIGLTSFLVIYWLQIRYEVEPTRGSLGALLACSAGPGIAFLSLANWLGWMDEDKSQKPVKLFDDDDDRRC